MFAVLTRTHTHTHTGNSTCQRQILLALASNAQTMSASYCLSSSQSTGKRLYSQSESFCTAKTDNSHSLVDKFSN